MAADRWVFSRPRILNLASERAEEQVQEARRGEFRPGRRICTHMSIGRVGVRGTVVASVVDTLCPYQKTSRGYFHCACVWRVCSLSHISLRTARLETAHRHAARSPSPTPSRVSAVELSTRARDVIVWLWFSPKVDGACFCVLSERVDREERWSQVKRSDAVGRGRKNS